MRRREFITLFGGITATWPLVAHAQQAGGIKRVGMLMAYSEGDPEGKASVDAFRQELAKLGWTDNIQIAVQWVSKDHYKYYHGRSIAWRLHRAFKIDDD